MAAIYLSQQLDPGRAHPSGAELDRTRAKSGAEVTKEARP